MGKLASLRAFVRVVEAGGFAAAAREMDVSRSAVNKLVAALEDDLGVQLLQRSTRRVNPTETGLAFYERCVEILADLEAAEQAVKNLHAAPRGTLKVNAPMSFGTLHLGPAIADFAAQYPALRVQVVLEDRFVDPIEEGYDLTLRIADLRHIPSSQVVQKITPVSRLLCAAPSYLTSEDGSAPLRSPTDLQNHTCLHYGYLTTGNVWQLTRHSIPSPQHPDHTALQHPEAVMVTVRGNFCSNNGEVLRAAAQRGLGIVLLPQFLVAEDLAAGRLVPVLPDWLPPPIWLGAVYPAHRHLSAKVRLLVDFLRDRFEDTTP
jgi:DNA-binding transcriptional LysR family regulator